MMAPMIPWRIGYFFVFQLFFLQVIQAQPDFTASDTTGCTPYSVSFELDPSTVDTDTISNVAWNFGDGTTENSGATDAVTHIYTSEGKFSVSIIINDRTSDPYQKDSLITVHRTLSSAFTYEEYAPNHNFRFIPTDRITDPTGLYFFNWRYTEIISNDIRTNTYPGLNITNQDLAIDSVTLDTGIYHVLLWIDDTFGCLSRAEDTIRVYDEIQLPNVFVAGRPSPYQFYTIDPLNPSIHLRFQVFNRYGLKVFEQEAPVIRWDGNTNTGKYLTVGVYYYILEVVEGENAERYNQNGFIHLYRAD